MITGYLFKSENLLLRKNLYLQVKLDDAQICQVTIELKL